VSDGNSHLTNSQALQNLAALLATKDPSDPVAVRARAALDRALVETPEAMSRELHAGKDHGDLVQFASGFLQLSILFFFVAMIVTFSYMIASMSTEAVAAFGASTVAFGASIRAALKSADK
jgi:hypothetical protein